MSKSIYDKLVAKEATLAVIGLGYVGLPIALEFARKIKVVGFDINQQRVDLMRNNIDPSNELEASAFEGTDILFTANINDLKEVDFFVVAVPTPIDSQNNPDLTPLLGASKTVGKVLSKGNYVVFESTVYPGCTEEDCIPVLEAESGLKFPEDFKVGYSPERINPGDKQHTLQNVIKVVSGCDDDSLDNIAKVYELVVEAGVHRAASIKVAEAAKIIENTQRDVNIALINELSIIFNRLGINTFDVLEAAGTKWNFLKFSPGLVGGHCIGVDPFYLAQKAQQIGYYSELILSARRLNDSMGAFVASEVVKLMIKNDLKIKNASVLILGVTFKENCPDMRNSKVWDVVDGLLDYGCNVLVYDPWVDWTKRKTPTGVTVLNSLKDNFYDSVVLAVAHHQFLQIDVRNLLKKDGIIYDVKGVLTEEVEGRL